MVQAGGGDLGSIGLAGQRDALLQLAAGLLGRPGQPQRLAERAQQGGAASRVERVGQRLRRAQDGERVAILAPRLIGVGLLQQRIERLRRIAGRGGGGQRRDCGGQGQRQAEEKSTQ